MNRISERWRPAVAVTAGLILCALLAAVVRTPQPSLAPRLRAGAEDGFPGKKPNDWFHLQRAYPGSEIPMHRYEAALEQHWERAAASRREGERGAVAWEPAGPTNIMGRVTCITAHSSNPNRIFIGAAAGGVFRTTNAGVTWEAVTDRYGIFSMGDLATDPQNPDVVYAGTGEPNSSGDSYSGTGLWRTVNGGETWEYLGLRETRHIARVVVDPTNSSRIWVAAMGRLFSKNPERGVYRSDDGGATWVRKLFSSDSTGAIDLAIDPSDPNTVYAALWERIRTASYRRAGGWSSALYKSTDGGESWHILENGLPAPAPDIGRIGIAVAPSAPSTVYAIYADDPGYFAGVYKSTNAGASWSRVSDGALSDLYSSFGWYFGQIRVLPNDANRVFTLGVPLYRTTNGGSSWGQIGGSMHVDHHALWIDPSNPQRMIEGNDGGLYWSTNGGTSWTPYGNLPITQFYAITIDNQLPHRLYGGTQDNGTMRTLTGALNDWQVFYGGDGFYCLVEPANSNVIYAEYQYGGLGKSTNGGSSFNGATNGINSGDRRNWMTPVVMDPTNSQVLYYGTYRLYRTTNGASNWTAISSDLTGGPGGGNLTFPTITTIAVAPSDPATIYCGTDDGHLWVTTNTGGNWTNVSAGIPDRWVTRVAVDPMNRDIAYATVSGYKWDEWQPHVFRTTNRGADWTDISGNLPDGPVNDIIVDPLAPGTLYIGTDFGVYVTRNLGARWDVLGAGFPVNSVNDLELHAPTRTLVAGTHGRSMFKLALPGPAEVEEWAAEAHPSIRVSGANPFRDRTEIAYTLPRGGTAGVRIVEVSGRIVRDLIEGEVNPGTHSIEWDGRDASGRAVAPGVYFARVETAEGLEAARIVRIR